MHSRVEAKACVPELKCDDFQWKLSKDPCELSLTAFSRNLCFVYAFNEDRINMTV